MDNLKGFEITNESIVDKLYAHKQQFHEKGIYVGWDIFHKHYTMQLGNCTDWTGYPMSGKTQVLMECLLNTSINYGWKHLVYFPDVGNNVEIIADLIHKKTGKCFDPLKKNAISDEEIKHETKWILEHFMVLTKKDVKAKMTPIQFWDLAVQIKNTNELHTASIDSWKDLSHNYNESGGYSQYLEIVLPYRNQIAEDNKLHLHTIIHPKLTEKLNGKRMPPVPYDLKGGSEWFNSGKCMITVHRDSLESNEVRIFFNKIKPRNTGTTGEIIMRFDVELFKYYYEESPAPNIINRIYASAKDETNIEQIIEKTNLNHFQNNNFDDTLPF